MMMEMKDYNIKSLAAALMLVAALAGCTDKNLVEEPKQTAGEKTYTMTITATKGDTRALSLSDDGKTLNATWTAGDEVTVYNVTKGADLGGTLKAQSDGASTTLEGTLTGDIDAADLLTLKFLSPSYGTQDGTLAYIAANCDYAEATVTVASVVGDNITTTSGADFQNRQAIVRFTLKEWKSGNAFNANTLKVDAGGTTINVTPVAATDVLYVAVPGINSKTVALYATAEATATDVYTYTKDGVTFSNGQFYAIGVKVDYNNLATPLTLQASEDGTLSFRNEALDPVTYRVNGGAAQTIAAEKTGDIPVITGDKVAFYGNNDEYGWSSESSSSNFSGVAFLAYGNIMSLCDPLNYRTAKSLPTGNHTFAYLFYGSNVSISTSNQLQLPAETLRESCYAGMFKGCTNLTTAPKLPAKQLANSCYLSMFEGCTSLTSPPLLPATNLKNYCYKSMFKGCTSLTHSPSLPATDLHKECYKEMFMGCTSLRTAGDLSAKEGYDSDAINCCASMFQGCTSLTTAPEINIISIKDGCCKYMFKDCSSLNTVTCKKTTHIDDGATTGWLYGVASTGTFYAGSHEDIWTKNSVNGIPGGWTIK